MPDPETYVALRPAWPVSSASKGGAPGIGEPTDTASEKRTCMRISPPIPYAAAPSGDETPSTTGSTVSTAMPDVPASESGLDGWGRDSAAAWPVALVMAAPFAKSADAFG